MLRAILHGKAGRVDGGDRAAKSWRELFKEREDLLTSVFFGRLQFLSVSMQQSVLGLLVGERESREAGAVQEIEFWPRLLAGKNRSHVEPDVLIHCEHVTLMVEVKPPFGGEQYELQWLRELDALALEKEHDNEEIMDVVRFVALGRNFKGWQAAAERIASQDYAFELSIHAREWELLAFQLKGLSGIGTAIDDRVLDEWGHAFQLFGVAESVPSFSSLSSLPRLHEEAMGLFVSASAGHSRAATRGATITTGKTGVHDSAWTADWSTLYRFYSTQPLREKVQWR